MIVIDDSSGSMIRSRLKFFFRKRISNYKKLTAEKRGN